MEDKLNKHRSKTLETRRRLLEAAEQIFARDGYEGAELGEIAALAGRTKGAIYAQFRSKEDVFLALLEARREKFQTRMEQMLGRTCDSREHLEQLRQFALERMVEPAWGQLLTEFTLFALRHPEAQIRLRSYLRDERVEEDERRYAEILGPAPAGALGRRTAAHLLFPLLSALALEAQIHATTLDRQTVERAALKIFDALFEQAV